MSSIRKNPKLLVAAIDFGTTFSGFAYSFTADFKRCPLKIYAKRWNSVGGAGLISQKTPTTLLLNPKGEFEAFGYKAEELYSELADDDDHHGWYYFKHFKMLLHDNENLNRQTEITDDQGHKLPAREVFAHCIKYLKDELHESLKSSGNLVKKEEIRWVLTVPAIWSDAAKQFMREAAIEAGIPDNQLTLALEPEAASIYAKEILIERNECNEEGIALSPYAPGTKYMVLDLGGGTVDVTVREVQKDRTLKELTNASGGNWGGLRVNEEIHKFIRSVFGDNVVDEFLKNNKACYLDLDRDIETKKRSFELDRQGRLIIKCPTTLLDTFESMNGGKCQNTLASNCQCVGNVDFKKERLRIKQEAIADFLKPSVEGIVTHIRNILSKPVTNEVKDIILVGGFAECYVIREGVKTALPHMRIVVPDDAGLAVLKGAVLYGHNPEVVSTRVSKFTYGTSIHRYFMKGHDPESKQVVHEGVPYCRDVFNIYAEAEQSFNIGQTVQTEVFPLTPDMTKMSILLYKCASKNPKYVTEKGCSKIGKMLVDMPDTTGGLNRKVVITMTYGDTELLFEGIDENTGKKVSVCLDML